MDGSRWVAFLRGMNLGGRRLTNDVEVDEVTGGTTVRTHGTVKRLTAKYL